MQLIDLESAVSEIHQACEDAGADPGRSPFFLIVGAGISWPSVSLAPTIIDHCRGVAERYQRTGQPTQLDTLSAYSHWFGLAYRHPRQRQKYLRSLIENKPISLANLRLAHLLSASRLTNLIVTTNFDDLLTKALRLFGTLPAVCDHPQTVGRIDADSNDVQIVHVHGSYLFYDCANLQGEVAGRAHLDQETSLTIVGLLDSVLWTRSPLIIGYSGWEGDVIMGALRRRLRGGHPMGHSLYWFCYKRDALDVLPPWLKNSSEVRFVVPPEAARPAGDRVETATANPLQARRREESDAVPTLEAREVFEQLIKAFGAETPPLFADPIRYFAAQLEASLPPEEITTGDPYSFKVLIRRVREAARVVSPPSRSGLEQQLEALRNAIRASRYDRAIRAIAPLVRSGLDRLSSDQQREVLTGAELSGQALLQKQKVAPDLMLPLAEVLAHDQALEQRVPLADDTVLISGARSGLMAYETMVNGKMRGAFVYHFLNALRDVGADRDGDGKVSLREAVIEAGVRLIASEFPQAPAIAGKNTSYSLFRVAPTASESPRGRILALLVGVAEYREKAMNLAGPLNDIAQFTTLLRTSKGRLARQALVRARTNQQATLAKIKHAFKWLAKGSRGDDVALFSFSGHSTYVDGTWVLMTHTYDGGVKGVVGGRSGAGFLPVSDVVEWLKPVKARQKVIVVG